MSLEALATAVMRRRAVQRLRYELIYAWPGWRGVSSFNGGFHPAEPDIARDFPREPNQIQLYRELFRTGGVAAPDGLAGLSALELAAGRGAGLAYARRHLAPASLVGVELTASGVRHGRRQGLPMRRGLAQRLPFAAETFDVVFTLDSFFHLAEREAILPEARRVLKPDGLILVGDFILEGAERAAGELRRLAEAAGLEVETLRDVTNGVVASFEEDAPRKTALLRRLPSVLQGAVVETLTLPGTRRYAEWRSGERSYVLAALRAGR